jgi:hypothetical protein
LYRIEVNLGIEAEYVFSIDGVRFDDLPVKPPVAKKLDAVDHNNSRYGTVSDLPSSSANRRTSGSTTQAVPARVVADTSRSSFQSPVDKPKHTSNVANEFDPFAAGAEPFDPFGNNSIPKPASTQPKLNSPAKSVGPSSASTTPTRAAAAKPSNHTATASIFGVVDDTPADPFATKTSSLSSFDAFGGDAFAPTIPQTMTGASRASTNSNLEWGSTTSSVAAFDPFNNHSGGNDFAPTQSTSSAFGDPFASTSTSSVNPFDQHYPSQPFQSSSSSTTPNKGNRRASAAEIALDFTGLTIAPEPPKMSAPRDVPVLPPQPVAPEPVKTEEEVVDPWASNLVDLDLSGRAAQRRSSQLGGPSLNNLMGQPTSAAPARRSSTINPQDLLNSMNDPFGAPSGVLPTTASTAPSAAVNTNPFNSIPHSNPYNAAQAISSIGAPAMHHPPMGAPTGYGPPPAGYGTGLNNGYAAPPGSMMGGTMGGNTMSAGTGPGRSSMIIQPSSTAPYATGYGMPPASMHTSPPTTAGSGIPTNTRASFIANNNTTTSYPQQHQPKSSLDTLDWRA